jgi:hypothetical protein
MAAKIADRRYSGTAWYRDDLVFLPSQEKSLTSRTYLKSIQWKSTRNPTEAGFASLPWRTFDDSLS